jgi:anti-sigma factor RsiW
MSKIVPARVDQEDLMRFLDGEVTPEERAVVERFLETSSELRREVAIFRSMKEELQDLSLAARGGESVWKPIRSRITVPTGWVLAGAGLVVWAGYGIWAFVRSPSAILMKLATGGIAIGILVLLAHVIWERYRESRTDPYRDVHR